MLVNYKLQRGRKLEYCFIGFGFFYQNLMQMEESKAVKASDTVAKLRSKV